MVKRFADLLPVQQGHLIGADDQRIGKALGHNLRLDPRQAPGSLLCAFPGKGRFIHIGRGGLERDLQGGKQLTSIYGGRGKDKRLRIQDIP